MNINDLPVEVLTNVASFLPKPSRALFAISLTAPSSSWLDAWVDSREERQLSETSKAIMSPSSQWEILDFEEVEKSLAMKLTDKDLYVLLTCTKQTVKQLNLTGCIIITGWGLAPLRGSTTLELLDLSLLKMNPPRPKPMFSQDIIIPILDSIISVQGSSLYHVRYPHQWLRSGNVPFEAFEDRFTEHLGRLGIISSETRKRTRKLLRDLTVGTSGEPNKFVNYGILCCTAFYFATYIVTNYPVLVLTLMVMKIGYRSVMRYARKYP